MTKENAHLYLPFVQALAEGKEIEFYEESTDKWSNAVEYTFMHPAKCYRIKPEKKLVPFTWEDRGLLIRKIIKSKDGTVITTIIGIVKLVDGSFRIDLSIQPVSPNQLLIDYTFLDGSPCGKEVEE